MWSASKERAQERALALWNKLHDAFGESLVRKFGSEPPQLWIDLIGTLTDFEIERGLRRTMGSGRRDVPNLPEFKRLCIEVGDTPEDRPPALPAPAYTGDGWDLFANRMLLDYIFAQARTRRRYFNAVETRCLVQAKNELAFDMRDMTVHEPVTVGTARQWFLEHAQRALKTLEHSPE